MTQEVRGRESTDSCTCAYIAAQGTTSEGFEIEVTGRPLPGWNINFAFGIGASSYGGDVEKVYAPIFGEEGKPDNTPAGAPNIVAVLDYMHAHYPHVRLSYVTLHDPGTAGQHIQVLGEHARRLIYGESYTFGASGQFHGVLGMADGALGKQAAASNYRLHFGNFGGLPVKIAYALFGLVLTAICATGSYIWLGKRERRGINQPRLRAAWDAVVWGTPLMLGSGPIDPRAMI